MHAHVLSECSAKRQGARWTDRRRRHRCLGKLELSYRDMIGGYCTSDAQRAHYVDRLPQVAVVANLRHRQTGRKLLACSTHLCCNFEHPDTQLAQAQVRTGGGSAS